MISFCFIKFRSYEHLRWFVINTSLLSVTVAILLLNQIFGISLDPVLVIITSVFMGLIYMIISVCSAIVVIKLGNGPIFSVDCIWFNGVISLIYFVICVSMVLKIKFA